MLIIQKILLRLPRQDSLWRLHTIWLSISWRSDINLLWDCQSGSNTWAAIGGSFGSNYSNVTGARTFNTTYSNGLGYPIVVYVVGGSNNIVNNKYIYGYVNALCVVSQATTDANAGYGWADTLGNITFIVPAGATYFVSAPQSYTVLKSWVELR